jgi:hypothetical protein
MAPGEAGGRRPALACLLEQGSRVLVTLLIARRLWYRVAFRSGAPATELSSCECNVSR